jgi:NAD+ diphosphatase
MTDVPPLARSAIDRAAHRRADEEWLAQAWAHPASRVIVVEGGRSLVADDRLVWWEPAAAPAGERLFLGIGAADPPGAGRFAVMAPLPTPGSDAAATTPSAAVPVPASLRDAGAWLSDLDAGALAHAAALEQWHARHPRCPLCGEPTVVELGGHVRRCIADGSEHHPRTDPAVIMLVTDADDRALLGRQPSWPANRMSTLAGYVEAGESLEAAVVREVAEEAGVAVGEVVYVASQPWPFPSSLMLAFTARATTTDIVVDPEEIAEARWFTRDELRDALADGTLRLPMAASVAYHLIQRWLTADGGRPVEASR